MVIVRQALWSTPVDQIGRCAFVLCMYPALHRIGASFPWPPTSTYGIAQRLARESRFGSVYIQEQNVIILGDAQRQTLTADGVTMWLEEEDPSTRTTRPIPDGADYPPPVGHIKI